MKNLWNKIQLWYDTTDDDDLKLNLFGVIFWAVIIGVAFGTFLFLDSIF
jgi:hypothetical protein